MIRTFFVLLTLILFFIVGIFINLRFKVFYKNNPMGKYRASQKIISRMFKFMLFFAGTKKTVIGQQNIPKGEPILFVGNHSSYFDILVSHSCIPEGTGFVAKKELGKIPFLGTWMDNIGCIFLDRDNIKEGLKTILHGIELLKGGQSLFIFPEGTRNHDTKLLPFKEGSLKLAEKSGCAIIPVALSHTDDIWENNKNIFTIKGAKVTIQFGEPIYSKDLAKEERKFLGSYVQKKIETMLENYE